MPNAGSAMRSIAGLGQVMQMAYLPSDFDAALRYWTQVIGAGPFFLLENVTLDDARYQGSPTAAVFSLALGYWGDMQIELIRPENDESSVYNGVYGVRDRLHHVCLIVDSADEARRMCAATGAKVVFEARVGESGEVLYIDPGAGPGGLVEVLHPAPGTADLFALMREAHRVWDGTEPMRKLT